MPSRSSVVSATGMPVNDACWCFNLIDTCSHLTSVDLSRCSLTPNLLASLALVLKNNTSLRFLNLSGNAIPFDALKRFLLTLQLYNFTISRVRFTMEASSGMDDFTNVASLSELHDISESIFARNMSLMSVCTLILIGIVAKYGDWSHQWSDFVMSRFFAVSLVLCDEQLT